MPTKYKPTLEDAKRYFDLITSGATRKDAAHSVHHTLTVTKMEDTPEYKIVLSASDKAVQKALKEDLYRLQARKMKAYDELLEDGAALISSSDSQESKLKAHENQRRNLNVHVVEQAATWNSPDRNKTVADDILEGVVIE